MMKLDNIHIDLSPIFSYNKAFNFVISEREAGKSTKAWLFVWKLFQKGNPTLVIRRKIIDITPAYIDDTLQIFLKFVKGFSMDKVFYNRGACKDGIVDVKYDGKLMFRIIGLSKDLYALKGLIIRDIGLVLFDEFICNMRLGEKYLKDEAFKFKELYNTFQRESNGTLRCLFLGNPYSLYNPYFADLGIETSKLKPGAMIVEKDKPYAIWCYTLSKELREHILAKNPLYQFDDAYTKYAFNGEAINDANIRIDENKPQNFKLEFGFRIDGHFIGIYENNDFLDDETEFYVEEIKEISARKKVFCFDFNDLMDRTALVSLTDRRNFVRFKNAFRRRKVLFNNLQCYYLLEEVYTAL